MAAPVLHVLVTLGRDQYALPASQVVEVVPLVRLKALPGAPRGAVGLMNYRGAPIPVVDLSLLATGDVTRPTTTARIVIVRHDTGMHASDEGLLGLLAPSARDAVHLDPDAFIDAGVTTDGARYLGRVLARSDGVLQQVTVGALLTPELRDALARATEAA